MAHSTPAGNPPRNPFTESLKNRAGWTPIKPGDHPWSKQRSTNGNGWSTTYRKQPAALSMEPTLWRGKLTAQPAMESTQTKRRRVRRRQPRKSRKPVQIQIKHTVSKGTQTEPEYKEAEELHYWTHGLATALPELEWAIKPPWF